MSERSINLVIQDHTGDRKLRLKWSQYEDIVAKDEDERVRQKKLVDEEQTKIREMFEGLQKEGYRFFSVKKILGFIPKKGKEVKKYDPNLGELIYQLPESKGLENKTLIIEEVEMEQPNKYEEPKKFNPTNQEIESGRDYIATKPMRAG